MTYLIIDVDCADVEMLELCASHYSACWQETYADRLTAKAMEDLLEQSSSTEIRSWLLGDGNRALTVVNNRNRIIGSGACNCIGSRCYVWGMYVRQDRQGEGVGSLLLDKFAKKAKGNHSVAMEVTVLTSSDGAIDFYKSNGFVEIEKTVYDISNGVQLPSTKMELVI